MKTTVLLVDDRKRVREDAAEALANSTVVDLIIAKGVKQAAQMARCHFLRAAFVDLNLDDPEDSGEATGVFAALEAIRPVAKRVVYTQAPESQPAGIQGGRGILRGEGASWRSIIKQFHPLDGNAHAAFLRSDFGSLGHLIEQYVEHHKLYSDLVIDNLPQVTTAVGDKFTRYRDNILARNSAAIFAVITANEVHYVISQLLRIADKQPDNEERISHIELLELGRGKSSAAVFRGQPRTRRGDLGLLCIFKLGPRMEIEREIQAYDQYVRFTRRTTRRVEVLSHVLGDMIGGVCYSFAGESPVGDGVESLQDIVERGDWPRVIAILQTELNPEGISWRGTICRSERVLGEFFCSAYNVQPIDVLCAREYAREFVTSKDVGGIVVDHPARWIYNAGEESETAVLLPEDSDNADLNVATRGFRSSIVHGDMNGENIIVARQKILQKGGPISLANVDQVILIDYRHTRRGPVFLDFAALEATVRLASRELEGIKLPTDFRRLHNIEKDERVVADRAWGSAMSYDGAEQRSTTIPDDVWTSLSTELIQLARQTFATSEISIERVRLEYSATCFYYIVRLLNIERLCEPNQRAARARLMVWMSSLLSFMRPMMKE